MKIEFDNKTFVVEYNENGGVDVFYVCQDKTCKLIVGEKTYLRFGPNNYISENNFIPGLVSILKNLFFSIENSKAKVRYEVAETEKEFVVFDNVEKDTYSFYYGFDCCWNMFKNNTWCGSFKTKSEVMAYIREKYSNFKNLAVV